MRTLYLHCGLAKTGTTAIQHALADARESLWLQDVDYPDLCTNADGLAHHNISRELLASPKYRPKFGAIADMLHYLDSAARFSRVVLSSEGLTPALMTAPDRTLDFIRALRLRSDRLVVLFTCRRIWRINESMYLAQLAKGNLPAAQAARPAAVGAWMEKLLAGVELLRGAIGGMELQWCDVDGRDSVSAMASALDVDLPGHVAGPQNLGRRIGLRAASLLYQAQFTADGDFREPRLAGDAFRELRRRILHAAKGEHEIHDYHLISPVEANAIQQAAREAAPEPYAAAMRSFLAAETGRWAPVSLAETNIGLH